VSPVFIIVGLVALQRLGELALAARNTRRLMAAGAVEFGRRHYPLFILLHAAWLAAILLTVPADAAIDWPVLALFVILQALRVWIVATLGPYWTTRIISAPGKKLVRRGPYRYLRHPNYLVVAGEIFLLPMVFGAWPLALVFSIANLALLAWRIRIEDRALAERRLSDIDEGAISPPPSLTREQRRGAR
jgi:methyltransferase